MVLCFFPVEVLTLWMRSPELALHVRPLLPILAAAILANCASAIPYIVVIASGHTRLPLLVNAVSLPFMVAGCFLAIRAFGVCGPAWCWLAFNLICFGFYGRYCSARIFPINSRLLLYGFPIEFLIVGAGVGVISKLLLPNHLGSIMLVLWLFSTITLGYLAGILVLKREERRLIAAALKQYGLRFRALFGKVAPGVAPIVL